MKIYKKIILTVALSLPSYTYAQSLQNLITASGSIVDRLIAVLIGIALLTFLFGLVRFIFKLGDDKSVEGGRRLMIWGIIALFVMVSVWGIVNFIQVALLT